MKRSGFVLLSFLPLITILISCNKEEIINSQAVKITTVENAQFRVVAPAPNLVDLIIKNYYTDIPSKSTICTPDSLLPNTHCDGGVRTFISFATIQNIGVAPLPAGATIDIQWDDLTWGLTAMTTIILINPLLPQDSIIAAKSYYVGPCDCVNYPDDENCFVHRYNATVDPLLQIPELIEFNNTSDNYETCDGCGPCALPVVEPL